MIKWHKRVMWFRRENQCGLKNFKEEKKKKIKNK